MKTHTAQQEILLMTGTSFSSRAWREKDDKDNKNNFTPEEKLKEACWNGMLPEMLPEICGSLKERKLYLWQIREAYSFIEAHYGEAPAETEKYFSINPYSLLPRMFFS
jgi:hypothetical protein